MQYLQIAKTLDWHNTLYLLVHIIIIAKKQMEERYKKSLHEDNAE